MFRYEVELGGQRLEVVLRPRGTEWEAEVAGRSYRLRLVGSEGESGLSVELDGQKLEIALDAEGGEPGRVRLDDVLVRASEPVPAPVPAARQSAALFLPVSSPMAGVVQEVLVQPGQVVQRGERLLVLEAMKMENTIYAPSAGRVADLAVEAKKTVLKGQQLLQLQALKEETR